MATDYRRMAQQLVGQQVVVRETNGKVHRGILQRIEDNGIQLRPSHGQLVAAKMRGVQVEQALADGAEALESEPVFFAPWFLILFALIGGLWAWGAYPGYGYGYGAGGYAGRAVRPYGGYGPYRRRW